MIFVFLCKQKHVLFLLDTSFCHPCDRELRRLRELQGLSKSKFALMVGVSRRYLIKLESAQASPTLEMMERIAAGLGVTVRDMVDFDAIVRNADSEGEESSEEPAIAAEYSG
jgi:transcriptional regulator with XRE-family HTH domain